MSSDSNPVVRADTNNQKESGRLPSPKRTAPPLAIAPFGEPAAKQYQAAWADYLGLPVEFENSLGMKFVLIPPGKFLMGLSDVDGASRISKQRQQQIQITTPFYLGVHEVTQGNYVKVVGSNPSMRKGESHLPVEMVSWIDASEFCRRLSALPQEQLAQGVYRLPTDAEWEYACRAGSTSRWHFGNDELMAGQYAWYSSNSNRSTHPVGSKKPNHWELYDMHGNVYEWCSDVSFVNNSSGRASGLRQVIRGGNWAEAAQVMQSHVRPEFEPSRVLAVLGFRIARSLSEE